METTDATVLPVTVIGGYLGAGKTTLVNHLLRNAEGLRLAVLVNEFGQLPIDADLIESQDDNIISIAGGCVCCSYGNDLIMAMLDLVQLTPRPQHVLLEASGVALPGAIASSVGLLAQYRLDGVLVLADAETVHERARDVYMGDTVRRQLHDADLIILNKIDLVEPNLLATTRAWLGNEVNGQIIETRQSALSPGVALGRIHTHSGRADDEETHHGELFETASFRLEQPVDAEKLALDLTSANLGIIRAKGFVRSPDGKMLELQIVGDRWTVVPAQNAPSDGIVFIGAKARFQLDLIANVIIKHSPATTGGDT